MNKWLIVIGVLILIFVGLWIFLRPENRPIQPLAPLAPEIEKINTKDYKDGKG